MRYEMDNSRKSYWNRRDNYVIVKDRGCIDFPATIVLCQAKQRILQGEEESKRLRERDEEHFRRIQEKKNVEWKDELSSIKKKNTKYKINLTLVVVVLWFVSVLVRWSSEMPASNSQQRKTITQHQRVVLGMCFFVSYNFSMNFCERCNCITSTFLLKPLNIFPLVILNQR